MHCFICGAPSDGCICPRCGFDLSLSRELYPTFMTDTKKPEAMWVRRNQIYLASLQVTTGRKKAAEPNAPKSAAGSSKRAGASAKAGKEESAAPKKAASAANTGGDKLKAAAAGSVRAAGARTQKPVQKPLTLPSSPSGIPESDPALFKVRTLDEKTCEITGLVREVKGRLVIPGKLQGRRVVSIAPRAFMGRYGLSTVLLPASLRQIGTYGFYGCKNLKGLLIHNGTTLDRLCFGGCGELELVRVYRTDPPGFGLDGSVAVDAFWDCDGRLRFQAPKDSAAGRFAYRNGFQVQE